MQASKGVVVTVLLMLQIMFCSSAVSESNVQNVYGHSCDQGVSHQPGGDYGVYVFCDDALATNIAVFKSKMNAPLENQYSLSERFWQGEEWANDVVSFAWLSERSQLLVSTSGVYGTGTIYLLDVVQKQSKELNIPGLKETPVKILISQVENDKAWIKYTTTSNTSIETVINIPN